MWTHGGYRGLGNVAPLLGTKAGPALIAGGARAVFDEVADATRLYPAAAIVAVNDTGMYLPRIDHWVSLHNHVLPTITTISKLAAWVAVRRACEDGSLNQDFATHGLQGGHGVSYAWAGLSPHFGLSGYFAMQVAYLMGYAPIVLCGCPGAPMPRFFEPSTGRADGFVYQGGQQEMVERELARLPAFKSVVRSMSGWTRDCFGAPEGVLQEV